MKARSSDEAAKDVREDGEQIWDKVLIWMKSSCSIRVAESEDGVFPG